MALNAATAAVAMPTAAVILSNPVLAAFHDLALSPNACEADAIPWIAWAVEFKAGIAVDNSPSNPPIDVRIATRFEYSNHSFSAFLCMST
jgi:1,6-anhydro-N-acetylmuramate kinase